MKKVRIIIIVLLCLAAAGGYTVFDNIFPEAEPISCPDVADILSVSLTENKGAFVAVEKSAIDILLENIRNAHPTRRESVNDYPTAENFFTVDIDATDRKYRYFIFEEKSKVCIEMPYEGIYESEQEFFDFLMKFFKDKEQ